MELTKKECERHLMTLKQLIYESSQGCLKPDECIEIQTFRQLIDEYFDNQLLKINEPIESHGFGIAKRGIMKKYSFYILIKKERSYEV